MAVNELSFGKTWESSTDFPTIEPNEAQVRADLQYHPDAIKDYINETLVPAVNSNQTNVNTLNTTVSTLSSKVSEIDLSGYAKTSDIPTKTSQLTNDSGFLTEHQSLSEYAKTSDIPTKTSQLTNDSNYLTRQQISAMYADKFYFDVTGSASDPTIQINDGVVAVSAFFSALTSAVAAHKVVVANDTIFSQPRLMPMTVSIDSTNNTIYLYNTTISSQWWGLSYTLTISKTAITRDVVEMYLGKDS